MQKLQCELCGSVDIIRTDDGFFQCQHCGCKYTLEQAKALLGTVETTIGTAELERLLRNAKAQYDIEQFDAAKSTYEEITKQFPDDYRGWLGLLRLEYRDYMYNDWATPYPESTKLLQKHLNICKKLCSSEKTVAEINNEWERFWNYIASKCKSGKLTYHGDCNPEVFKNTTPAMYEFAKKGFENARILNSLNVEYSDKGWVIRSEFSHPYYFWLGRCLQYDDSDGYKTFSVEINLPVIDNAYIAKIRADVQKYIDKKLSEDRCPYCNCYLKKNIFGKKCPSCGRKF